MRGEFRIRAKDLVVVEKEKGGWIESSSKFEDAVRVARMFRKHGKLGLICDGDFLFGSLKDGKCVGKRVVFLPDGTELERGFSLFARDLVVHDERSDEHWDVLFRNPSGSFCYVYSREKVLRSRARKFERVEEFERVLPRLRRNVMRNLDDVVALAIAVLLETRIRVGGEVYYKRNRHRGLSTLKKKNILIDGDVVRFDFVGKDGVPQVLEKKFSGKVVDALNGILDDKGDDDFVFLSSRGGILRDTDFEAGFEKFCGERFYPHIVRSAFATRETEKFLRNFSDGRLQNVDARKRVREFCLWLAGELGHKKFSKRKGDWVESFEVTLHYYVRPDLVERISKITRKKK